MTETPARTRISMVKMTVPTPALFCTALKAAGSSRSAPPTSAKKDCRNCQNVLVFIVYIPLPELLLFDRLLWSGNRCMQEQPHKVEDQGVHRHADERRPFEHGVSLGPELCSGYNTLKGGEEEAGQRIEEDVKRVVGVGPNQHQGEAQQEEHLQGDEQPLQVVHDLGDAVFAGPCFFLSCALRGAWRHCLVLGGRLAIRLCWLTVIDRLPWLTLGGRGHRPVWDICPRFLRW